jgi:Cys-rich protein (TIGR01571 family)
VASILEYTLIVPQVKEEHGIEEGHCQTCLAVTFCCPCALGQEYLEAKPYL